MRHKWLVFVMGCVVLSVAALAWAGGRWDHRLMLIVPSRDMEFMAFQDVSGVLLLESGDKLLGESQ